MDHRLTTLHFRARILRPPDGINSTLVTDFTAELYAARSLFGNKAGLRAARWRELLMADDHTWTGDGHRRFAMSSYRSVVTSAFAHEASWHAFAADRPG